ncbi:hypothetical protein P8452_38056 [Trifolium repens]|nr:hypothetical protein P8452_38056 [Trifolium repens]
MNSSILGSRGIGWVKCNPLLESRALEQGFRSHGYKLEALIEEIGETRVLEYTSSKTDFAEFVFGQVS